jgi:hypothetical protein
MLCGVVTESQMRRSRRKGPWSVGGGGGGKWIVDYHFSKCGFALVARLIFDSDCKLQKISLRYVKFCCWQENNGSVAKITLLNDHHKHSDYIEGDSSRQITPNTP